MDFDALTERIRLGRPSVGLPGADERERIFERSRARVADSRLVALPGRQPWRRATSFAVAAALTIAIATTGAVVLAHHPGEALRPGHSGTTTPKHRHHKQNAVDLARDCASQPADPNVVAYVVRQLGDALSPEQLAAVDLPSGRVAWSETFPGKLGQIWAIAAAPNGRTVYAVANSGERNLNENLVAVNAATGRARVLTTIRGANPEPAGIAVSPDGAWVIVAQTGPTAIDLPGPGGHTVTAVSTANPEETFRITIAGPHANGYSEPWGVAFATNRIAYVSSNEGMSEVSLASRKVLRTVTLPDSDFNFYAPPGPLAVSPNGSTVLVGTHGADLVSPAPALTEVSTAGGEIARTVRFSHDADQTSSIAFDCKGDVAFASTGTGLYRVEVSTGAVQPVYDFDGYRPDVEAVASLPNGAIWAVDTSGAQQGSTRFFRLRPGSTEGGAAVGDLPGPVEAMALGLSPSPSH